MTPTLFSSKDVQGLYSKHQDKLEQYVDLLLWWNQKINLVSRDVSRETINKHIEHSLIASFFLEGSEKVLDTGTGGGLPGIPLSILHPQIPFILNDIQMKKGAALRQMTSELGLSHVSIHISSIDQMILEEPVTVVSKHAFKIKDLMPALKKVQWRDIVLLKGLLDIDLELGYLTQVEASVLNLHEVMEDEWYKGKGLLRVRRIER